MKTLRVPACRMEGRMTRSTIGNPQPGDRRFENARRRHPQLAALSLALVVSLSWHLAPRTAAQQTAPSAFSVDQILSLPTPDNLTASPVGSTLAWTFNERGVRNIYVASAPDF